MNLLWYPVKKEPQTVFALNVMVALHRPKGHRKSYKQWKEGNIAPQVVFEFLSEPTEFNVNPTFFAQYGVQEYYIYDIERKELSGLIRYQEQDDVLDMIADMEGWTSPRLGVRFTMSSGTLQLYKPDGEPFLSYSELNAELSEVRSELSEARKKNDVLSAKLRELGINPDAL
jgi:Uma2 family endonuclease